MIKQVRLRGGRLKRSKEDIYDELLVIRCQKKESDAWNELVDRYSRRLEYFVARFVRDEHQVQNLLQEIWVQVMRSLPVLKNVERFSPWIFTIARRVTMLYFRKSYSKKERLQDSLLEDTTRPSFVDPADDQDDFERFDNAELVHAGLERLSPTFREILTLHFLESFSTNEIALILEIPTGTVKSRLYLAKRELKQWIIGHLDECKSESFNSEN